MCDKHLMNVQRKIKSTNTLRLFKHVFRCTEKNVGHNFHRPKDDENTKTNFSPNFCFKYVTTNHPQSIMIGVEIFMTFVNNANVKEIHDEILSLLRFNLVMGHHFTSVLCSSRPVICRSKCYIERRIKMRKLV